MTARNFSQLAAAIFTIVALAHVVRALTGWPVSIDMLAIPVWASWVGFAVAGVLAWLGFKASRG